MKPEFKIEGREATPAEYTELMHALLASQAATPTARACAPHEVPSLSVLDALFDQDSAGPAAADPTPTEDGERGVYLPVSGFLEASRSISSGSAARLRAAPGRYE